jgi:hypothetical protein
MTLQCKTLECFTGEVIHTRLNNGAPVCIRAIQMGDATLMREGIGQLSAHSRYLRFFSRQTVPTDSVIQKLVDVDGDNHLAWGALLTGHSQTSAIGAVHVFRSGAQSNTGELSFAFGDAYHGLGLARLLMAVLLINCAVAQIETLEVHILYENKAAANFARMLGAKRSNSPAAVSDYKLDVDVALQNLVSQTENKGLQAVVEQLSKYFKKQFALTE